MYTCYWRYVREQKHGALGRFMRTHYYLNGPFESQSKATDKPLPEGCSMKICPIPTKDIRLAKSYIVFALLFQNLPIIKGKN